GTGTNFEDDVLLVIRVLGQEQDLQFFFNTADSPFQFVEFLLRIGAHLGIFFVGQQRLALGYPLLQVFVFAVLLNHRRDFTVRLGSLLEFRRVSGDLRRRQSLGQFIVAGFDLVKSFKHENRRWSLVVGRWLLASGGF